MVRCGNLAVLVKSTAAVCFRELPQPDYYLNALVV